MNKRIYKLGLYEKSMPDTLDLKEKLSVTKSSGFDFLEVSLDETDEKLARLYWPKTSRQKITQAMLNTNTPIGSLCLSGHRKYPLGSLCTNTRSKSLDIMYRAIELAHDWGVRIVMIAGYDVYYEPTSEKTRAYFLENLIKSVDFAAKAGVMLAFETMETPFMDTAAKAMFYINEIRSPWLQLYPDLGNLTNASHLYSHCVLSDLAKAKGHLAALHLKESKPNIYREVPYGTGHVDFSNGIKTARDMGVYRFVAEFWHNDFYLAQINHAHDFLRGFLDSAF